MGIVGMLIVIVCVFGGFLGAGGHLHVIWQPFEVVIIGGAALGGFIIANSVTTMKITMKMVMHALLGGSISKQQYLELLQMLFQLFQIFLWQRFEDRSLRFRRYLVEFARKAPAPR